MSRSASESYRSLSRRRFLALSSLAAVPLIAGCTPAAPATQVPASTKPAATPAATSPASTAAAAAKPAEAVKRGGTLVQAMGLTVPTMDAHLNSLPEHIVYENVYDGLVRFRVLDMTKPDQKVEGVLAESWEQKDPKSVVFKLRQGVKFHDGSDFDAEVAKWNFDRARTHAKSYFRNTLAMIDTVTALDKNTLEVKVKSDNAALLSILGYTNGGLVRMISKAAFDKNGEEWLQRNPVGTGPFKFKEWVTDDRVIVERNPDYFIQGADGKSLPYLDGAVMRYVPDSTVSVQDMKAGTVHVLQYMAPKDVASVRADPNLDVLEQVWANTVYFVVGLNTGKPPFNDVRVRQAALYGIDRVGMHRAVGFGIGAPHHYPYCMEGYQGYEDSILKYDYNPDKVKELLTAAGYPNGIDIELKIIAREPENTIGEFAQQMWSNVGIRTKLVAQERLSWIDSMRAKNFDAGFWRYILTPVDSELARIGASCGGSANWGQWCDQDVDRLLNEGIATLDPKKRHDIYRQLWQLIQERAYLGTGYKVPDMTAHRKNVRGLDFSIFTPNLSKVWLA